ncbi:peptidyl-prolyl cis-trans isomerase [Pyxidicoccus parkwayensis]|uniref:peptidylprolyl isomerase n=1 Tax=Pyxidicoccus parkwayensis TaxID=2813578 RepID=A0ABX7P6M6_9BACT|nr:peptidyl-prolyl cis-trans isomerase [Pyxidicoccus parkwaysis]QSQ26140.1 peptidyl-prolyl cis-trans isomerase [Pyxidicoccus parkwaysis]
MKRLSYWARTAAVAMSLGVGVGGCNRGGSGSTSTEGEVVAVVGDGSITRKELEAKLAEQPAFVRSRYATLEKKKEFLDNLVRFELLVQEARRRGLEADPEVRDMLEKVMVQRLVQLQTEAPEAAEAAEASDAEARAFYDSHLSEYVKPERVKVSHLLLTGARGTPERQKALARAAQLATEIRRGLDVPRAFDAAVRANSQDSSTQASGGDLGFRTRQELEAVGGSALADAALSLKTVGQLSTPIETDQGVHLLMLQARQPGSEQTFEQAQPRIVQRLSAERRAKALDTLVQSLRDKTRVEIKEDVLTQVNPAPSEARAP